MMRLKFKAVVFCLAMAAANIGHSNAEDGVTDLPPVRAIGISTDGASILCYSADCALALLDLQTPPFPRWDSEIGPEAPVDKQALCSALEYRIAQRYKDPNGPKCNTEDPPSVPGLDPLWTPNGCGTGAAVESIAAKVTRLLFPDFTGDLDRPYPGVSFVGACNAHDRCWGVQGDRLTCDDGFRIATNQACNAAPLSGRNACMGIASGYHAGVTSAIGDRNYQAAGKERTCAIYAKELKDNGCDDDT